MVNFFKINSGYQDKNSDRYVEVLFARGELISEIRMQNGIWTVSFVINIRWFI